MTKDTPTVGGIYRKIAAIRKEVGPIAKNGVGPSAQGSYKYVSIDDILKAVVPLEDEQGVICYMVDSDMEFRYLVAEKPHNALKPPAQSVQGIGSFTFRFVDVEDGSFIDVKVPGEGSDSQDKSTRKAVTQAQKIAKIVTYDLITGEPDPDGMDGAADSSASAPSAVQKARSARTAPEAEEGSVEWWKQKVRTEFIKTSDEIREKAIALDQEAKKKGLTGVDAAKYVYEQFRLEAEKTK